MSGKRGPMLGIRAAERVDAHQVDVVPDQHEIPRREIPVHPAGSVGDDERPHTEPVQEKHREDDVIDGVPLVEVNPARHDGHGCAQLEQAGMAGDRRTWKAGNVGERHLGSRGLDARSRPSPEPRMTPIGGRKRVMRGQGGPGRVELFVNVESMCRLLHERPQKVGGVPVKAHA